MPIFRVTFELKVPSGQKKAPKLVSLTLESPDCVEALETAKRNLKSRLGDEKIISIRCEPV